MYTLINDLALLTIVELMEAGLSEEDMMRQTNNVVLFKINIYLNIYVLI